MVTSDEYFACNPMSTQEAMENRYRFSYNKLVIIWSSALVQLLLKILRLVILKLLPYSSLMPMIHCRLHLCQSPLRKTTQSQHTAVSLVGRHLKSIIYVCYRKIWQWRRKEAHCFGPPFQGTFLYFQSNCCLQRKNCSVMITYCGSVFAYSCTRKTVYWILPFGNVNEIHMD